MITVETYIKSVTLITAFLALGLFLKKKYEKLSINPSFWNFVECNGIKYPESPLLFNRSLIEISLKV